MNIPTCPNCKMRVLPKANGTCPSCGAVIEQNENPLSIQTPDISPPKMAASNGQEEQITLDERRNVMKRTISSDGWETFFGQISKQEIMTGTILPPQLILCCKVISMATRLAEGLPATANALLDGEIEVIELSDGQGAVRFPLKDGKDILQLMKLLGQGNYGTEQLVIKGGIAVRLPFSDRQSLRQSMGIPKIFAFGTKDQLGKETIIWW